MASSKPQADDPDAKGLPPGSSLPLAYKPPVDATIYYTNETSMKQCAPQALLRDLHRVEKDHAVPWNLFPKYPMIDIGASQALRETKALMAASYRIDIQALQDGPGTFRWGVQQLRGPVLTALTTPYKPRR